MSKWIRFRRQNSQLDEFGRLVDEVDFDEQRVKVCVGDLFDNNESTDEILKVKDLNLLTPCWPGKMLGLWKNVGSAIESQGLTIPEEPLFFLKTSNCYLPHLGEVRRPANYEGKVIFEGELGVVIGKVCKHVSEESADDYIFGYTNVNDTTAPELIKKDPTFPQWCRAKSMDTFGAFGPSISTKVDLNQMQVKTFNRGRIRQDYAVSDFIFSPQQIVSFLSQEMTLFPGDLIACGTGDGILLWKPGTTVEVRIDGLDPLTNAMASN
ncbi:MAG: fumarylacetoacetate hydrolase family protein [Pseudohongiellaceae bacterium]